MSDSLPDSAPAAPLEQSGPCPLSWGWYVKVAASLGLMAGFIWGLSAAWFGSPASSIDLGSMQFLVGQALAVSGFALYATSYLVLRRQIQGGLGKPGALVCRGFPWARIRHPMYLADLIWLGGFATMTGTYLAALLWMAIFLGIKDQIAAEESYLASRFRGEFEQWKSRSGRLLPVVGW